MLRAANIFPRNRGEDRPFGMVDVDSQSISDMLNQVGGFANTMKDKDAQRMREMMVFEKGLNRPMPQHQIQRPQNVVMGRQAGPSMQERFQEEERIGKDNAYKSREAALGRAGNLESALAVGKQSSEGAMARTAAEINGRETVAKMNKEMTVKAADDARADKATEAARARVEKGPLVNVADPDDPSKTISVRHNPATNKYERVKIDEDQAGTGYKQGTLPKPVANPAAQTGIDMAQETLNEISNNLLTSDDQLTDKAQWATGASHFVGKIPLPTQARAGQASLKRVASQQLLGLINHMKSQSRTGSTGMGNMSNQDRQALENAASKLNDPSLPEEEIRKEIVRVRDLLKKTANSSTPKDTPKDGKNKPSADELLKKHGYE